MGTDENICVDRHYKYLGVPPGHDGPFGEGLQSWFRVHKLRLNKRAKSRKSTYDDRVKVGNRFSGHIFIIIVQKRLGENIRYWRDNQTYQASECKVLQYWNWSEKEGDW